MTKEDFGNSTEGWICNNDDNYLKVRDNCYMIGKLEALHIKIAIS